MQKPMPSRARLVEQWLRRLVRHRPLVPVVGLGDVVDEPAWEERRQRQLRVDHELDAMLERLAAAARASAPRPAAGVIALNGAELRSSDRENS